jgi:4-amino-4-deoxy-L-arabinose transferase-like glycosyltransferase
MLGEGAAGTADTIDSSRASSRETLAGWGFVLAAWALFAGLSLLLRPLMPIDETRYAAVSWEMWNRGDFLVPHLNGLPYSDKPPLLFWLVQLGWKLFGVDDWWPRLVPALFSLCNLFLAAALARRLWPDRPAVARAAPAVLVGLLLWSLFTGMLMFDMLVAFCVLLALLGLEAAWRQGRSLPWLQVGAAMGLGILAKGPVALLVPLLTAALAPFWGKSGGGRRLGWRWWAGILGSVAVAAAIGLAWALPAARAGGPAYANAILFSQTEERLVHSFAHDRPWWWYLALLPVLLFPYSLWPPLWREARHLRWRAMDPGTRFCLAWTLPALLAFSLISGKQPHYLLPLFPGFALLATRLLDSSPALAPRRWFALPATAVLLLVAAVLIAAPLLAHRPDVPHWAGQVSPVAGVLLGLAALAILIFSTRVPGWLAAPSLLTLLLAAALYAGVSRAVHQAYDVGPVARHLASIQHQGRPVAWAGNYHGQFHFPGRLRRPFEEILPGSEQIWLLGHPGGVLVEELGRLPANGPRPAFVQPYRGGVLVVWERSTFHQTLP